jgi:hypothetical protein
MRQSLLRTSLGKIKRLTAGLCVVALLPLQTLAWGAEGHQVVARIALRQLSQKARQEVRNLLRPNETLWSVSTWADQIRQARPETRRWHFVDIPLAQTSYDPARDCERTPFGDCIIQALTDSKDLLASPDALARYKLALANARESRQARYEALKFLVHFVGDLHQPLHCADNDDRGGNDVRVTFFGQPSNLHKVWDSDIIARAGGLNTTANRVEALMRGRDLAPLRTGDFVAWAEEAHQLAQRHVYQNIPANKRLGQPYFQANRPVVDEQLLRAGVRLAALLNEVFQ